MLSKKNNVEFFFLFCLQNNPKFRDSQLTELINSALAGGLNWESGRILTITTENAQNLPRFLLRTYLKVDSAKVWLSHICKIPLPLFLKSH